jgi:hypothetical protein
VYTLNFTLYILYFYILKFTLCFFSNPLELPTACVQFKTIQQSYAFLRNLRLISNCVIDDALEAYNS